MPMETAVEKFVDAFQFDGQPLSSWISVVAVVPLFLGTIYAVRQHVAHRGKPYDLNKVVIVHNGALSILSGILFLALATELIVKIRQNGFWMVFCDPEEQFTHHGRLVFYYYINYLFKFVELFDTVLLALRGKPTPFLHTYHHAATLVLCWTQLVARSCVQWVPIVINLLVHVIMYMYYCLHACGIDVWWKKYLTIGQIVQFVFGIIGCFGGLGPRIGHDYISSYYFSRCSGNYPASFFGIFILCSYLALFVQLFRSEAYRKRTKGAKSPTALKES